MARDRNGQDFAAIAVRGGILPPQFLSLVAALKAPHQTGADYDLSKSLNIKDEIARYWRIANDLFNAYTERHRRVDLDHQKVGVDEWLVPLLRDVFGYADLRPTLPIIVGERSFRITHDAFQGAVPLVLTTAELDLDRADLRFADDGRRRAPQNLIQEFLNADDRCLWGITSNGTTLRLVRTNPSLSRPAYIEADLQRVFQEQLYADFAALWLFVHATRFRPVDGTMSQTIGEAWRAQAHEEGERALGQLRGGVTQALLILGNGFLENRANEKLRTAIADNTLTPDSYFQELLRLVYRLLFLFAAEERHLLFAATATSEQRDIYRQGYALVKLRERAQRRRHYDRHDDLWLGICITFQGLAVGQPIIGLSAFGGLFGREQCPHLDEARISNARLLGAIYALAFLRSDAGLTLVNYRDMGAEELGSVYESLLELHPSLRIDATPWLFELTGLGAGVRGSERKLTGSYYTPTPLVDELVRSALDPIIIEAIAGNPENPRSAVLDVKILDPACGSGHFLLAAARRVALEMARLDDDAVSAGEPLRQSALREVVQHCIYGVDRNPLAVELCRVALWIETMVPGRPLSFLDAHIRCGDALIGVFDVELLDHGIPVTAFDARDGDDPEVGLRLRRANKKRVQDMRALPLFAAAAESLHAVDVLPEDTVGQVRAKQAALAAAGATSAMLTATQRADLFCAAFFARKTRSTEDSLPLSSDIDNIAVGNAARPAAVELSAQLAREHRFFHWPLAFPDVFARGGFDVVLGNPPWEKLRPDVNEWFARYDPNISSLDPNAHERRVAEILLLPGVRLAWDKHRRTLYDAAAFLKGSGRFRLFAEGNLGKGDFDIYRMFVELALRATRNQGVAAQFVPENFQIGPNASAIRSEVFAKFTLRLLIQFENRHNVWFSDVHQEKKFCLYVAQKGGTAENFAALFGVDATAKLVKASSGQAILFPVGLIRQLSPDALAIPKIDDPTDLAIIKKIYARLGRFGEVVKGAPQPRFQAELHMGNDRQLFNNDPTGLPLFQGSMIDAFDYRAQAYVSGRGKAAKWRKLAFGAADKTVAPQWRVRVNDVPAKIGNHWAQFRIGVADEANPNNTRTLTAALLPAGVICGDKVPTVIFIPEDLQLEMLWLAVANSFCIDYVARKNVSMKMSKTVLYDLPLPKYYTGAPLDVAIASRALQLSASGEMMEALWNRAAPQVGLDPKADAPADDCDSRERLRAELDVLVARDLLQLSRDEMRYVLDPTDLLGSSCHFETFGALKRAEIHAFGEFRTRRLILETWDCLAQAAGRGPASLNTQELSGPELQIAPTRLS